MNQLSLVGHLTRDPQLRTLPLGGAVCDLRLAVNGSRDAQPLFNDIATFGRHAEACAQYLGKGREIAFTGRLVYSEWTGRDGVKRSKHSAAGQVEFRGSRPVSPAAPDEPVQGGEPTSPTRRQARRQAA